MHAPATPGSATGPSVLWQAPPGTAERPPVPECFADLQLDAIVATLTAGRDEYRLRPFFHTLLPDPDAVAYRHAVFHDLEDDERRADVLAFARGMRQVRGLQAQGAGLPEPLQRERLFLDAAVAYVSTVDQLAANLGRRPPASRGLQAVNAYLSGHVAGDAFRALRAEAIRVRDLIAAVYYELTLLRDRVVVARIDGGAAQGGGGGAADGGGARPGAGTAAAAHADVTDYPDAADNLRRAFERFGAGTARRRMTAVSEELAATPLEAQILRQVARLHPEAFDALARFVRRYPDPIDPTVARFDREVQFYLAVLHHVDRWRRSGIAFCYPRISDRGQGGGGRDGGGAVVGADDGQGGDKSGGQVDGAVGRERERVVGAVDLALADRLLADGATVVPNGYELAGPERVLVVTGANQGGKTTFARTVGQLHVLAALGCPVAAREARLTLPDRVLTLFEREEDLRDLHGKLQDELVRARELLAQATPASVAIVNEAVGATTAADALQVGRRVLRRLLDVGALGVWVTFVDELASMDPAVASMVCGVDPADPTRRTFELTRRPADGRAYAVAIARAHGLTYDELRRKLAP